jgi:hypothetical protein
MYSKYQQLISSLCEYGNIDNFKSYQEYTEVLEHVNPGLGQEYLDLIFEKTKFSVEEIKEFCNKNDSVGNPKMIQYSIGVVSPSSLRYIFHTHLILEHIQNLGNKEVSICEIGGGYGGLYMCINHFAPKYDITINKYTIVDLNEPLRLTEMFLQKQNIKCPSFSPAEEFGKNIKEDNMFLISNYCFSEISPEYQAEYVTHLFPKIKHGFLTWNCINIYDFGFEYIAEPEYPMSSYDVIMKNSYVRF